MTTRTAVLAMRLGLFLLPLLALFLAGFSDGNG